MSRNTVCKYVRSLEEKGLIRTERTTVTLKDGRKRNGSLLYTILPVEQVLAQHNQHQLHLAEMATERHRAQQKLAAQASPCVASEEHGRVRIAAPEVWSGFDPLFGALKV